MQARIVAINGSLKRASWELDAEEFSIGRELNNALSLNDLSVSRRHCVIRRGEDGFTIYDLRSHNGTNVNNVPVGERRLQHGDYIQVGTSLFRFLFDKAGPQAASETVRLVETAPPTLSIIELPSEDTAPAAASELKALIEVSTLISTVRGVENISLELLRMIFRAVPAERGAILLAEGTDDGVTSTFGLCKNSDGLQTVTLSRTVVERVLRGRVSIIGNEVTESEEFQAARSLVEQKTSALLCVPMLLRGRLQGLIYLDTSDPKVSFNTQHLKLLTAISSITSIALDNARHVDWLEDENERLSNEIKLESSMIGASPPMQEIYQFITKVAPRSSNVLVRGESGTGKELVARAIHLNSPRADGPFVAINCATLSEALLESELFGHEKGAFTGAVTRKKGKLEVAEGGTVFLDEVGELALPLQAKLLRVLQEHEMQRVGGVHPIKLDIRVVSATNRDLEEAIAKGVFRRDLYYRLNVVSCTMPRLRDRREDIPRLAKHFVAKHSVRCNRRATGVSREALEYLTCYDWPGNVRELENAIERAIVLGSTEVITPDDLPEHVLSARRPGDNPAPGLYESLGNAKRRLILEALEQSNYKYAQAAAALKIHPNNLHRLIKCLGLKVPPRGLGETPETASGET